MVQHFAFPEALFYRKTLRVYRHQFYTDPSPTFTIDGKTLALRVTRGVRIYDSPLVHDGSPAVLGLEGRNLALFCLSSFSLLVLPVGAVLLHYCGYLLVLV
jgi:hypothetical protein